VAKHLAPVLAPDGLRGRHHAIEADDSPTVLMVVPTHVPASIPPLIAPPTAPPPALLVDPPTELPATQRIPPPAEPPPPADPPTPAPEPPPVPEPPVAAARGWFERLGTAVTGRPRSVIAVWVLLLAGLSVLGLGLPNRLAAGGFEVPGSQSQQVQQILQDRFPGQAADPVVVVVQATDPGGAGALPGVVATAAARIGALDGVRSVRSFLDPGAAGQLTPDGTTTYLSVAVDGDQSEQLRHADDIEAALADVSPAGVEISVGGRAAFYNYQNDISRSDLEKAELITFPVTLLVLVLVFGSVVAAGLPVLLALVSLGITLGLLYLLTLLMPLSVYVTNTATVIGIGVGIDYALFIVTRFREALAAGRPPRAAVVESVATSGRSVTVSGLTVVVALAGMFLVDIQGFRSMAVGTMVVVTLAVLASLTLLPAVLVLIGRRIDRLTVLRRYKARHRVSGWHVWTKRVMRRPLGYLLAALAVLFLLAAPLTGIVLGQPSADTLPADSPPRVALDRLSAGFGSGSVGPVEIVVPTPGGPQQPENLARIGTLTQQLAADPEVAAVLSVAVPGVDPTPLTSTDGGLTRLVVIGIDTPQSDAGQDLVRRIRTDILPAAGLDDALVGGQGASDLDLTDEIEARLPWVIGGVLALSYLLLMVALRSIILPLKAIVMNLMSVGAAYGVVVALFQWGWGAELFGFRPEGFIQAFVPLFLFSVLFGLSMDYEVFLMTRMREEWERTGSNEQAVTSGLERTGRTVTSAALIMVVVFAAFTGSRLLAFKAMGFGLAAAVLIDATVVRVVAVPATMRLLGRLNWWLPRWLDRILPHLEPPAPVGQESRNTVSAPSAPSMVSAVPAKENRRNRRPSTTSKSMPGAAATPASASSRAQNSAESEVLSPISAYT
jgi:RND superfamily putative drug exporter